jgi:G3E family GTPase
MTRLPVSVIGGYLGAGKTTLVNHLLRQANGLRLAVLVNEFGELAIDEDLIEAEEDGLISIAGGCICCSFGNDLIGALQRLTRMSPPPEHILVESSGVAIPGAIVATMLLSEAFRSDGVIVVVDAETVQQSARDDYIGDTITRQLSDAEIVVANKMDLLPASARDQLMGWLADAAPDAVVIPANRGQVDPAALLGAVPNPGSGSEAAHSDRLFEGMVLAPDAGCNTDWLAEQIATGGFGVIRAKGHLRNQSGAMTRIHTVGKRWEVTQATKDHATGLVCLGYRDALDKSALLRLVEQSA